MDDIEFYEHQVKFEENLARIQERRTILEQEFFNLTKTDKKLQSIRTTKLRNYWKKVCERERKAQERNEALLRDVKEFEGRLSKVAADTAKLEKIKEKCEDQLTKLYPQWRYEIDLTKAKRQLEDSGMNIDSQLPAPTSLSSILNAPRGPAPDQIETPLFKLVPYNYERENPPPNLDSHVLSTDKSMSTEVQNNKISNRIVLSSSAEVKPVAQDKSLISSKPAEKVNASHNSYNSFNETAPSSRPTTSSKELRSLLKPQTSNAVNQGASFPTLEVSLDTVSTSSLETSSDVPYVPTLELKSVDRNERADSQPQKDSSVPPARESDGRVDRPDPVSSLHLNVGVDDIHQVEINETRPKDNFLNDLSDVSSVSSVDTPVSSALERMDLEEKSNFLAKKPDEARVSQAVTKASPDILSPKTSQPIKIPISSLEESLPSESVTTEPSQKGLPLTSNPAYQNMIRSSEMSSTFGMSHHFEEENDDDDLEKLISPKPKELPLSDGSDDDIVINRNDDDMKDESSSFSKSKASERLPSNKNTPKKPSFLASSFTAKKQKAPWDTDSGEEDSYKIPKAGQTLSADEDDFDFYD